MLWSRRSVFLALLVGGPGRCWPLRFARSSRSSERGAAAHQRRVGGRAGALRPDDLAAVPAVRRAGARRVLRHGAHRRRSRGQDDHLPVHAADSARHAVLFGKYLAYLVCTILLVLPVGRRRLLPDRAARRRAGRRRVSVAARRSRHARAPAWPPTARSSPASGRALKRPLVAGLVFAFGWEPAVLIFPGLPEAAHASATICRRWCLTRCRRGLGGQRADAALRESPVAGDEPVVAGGHHRGVALAGRPVGRTPGVRAGTIDDARRFV